jgi:hypothetical protein
MFPLCLLKQHVMKLEVLLHTFLQSGPTDEGEWLVSLHGYFTPHGTTQILVEWGNGCDPEVVVTLLTNFYWVTTRTELRLAQPVFQLLQ